MQNLVCALQDWSVCFPQSSGRPITKSHWPSKPYSLGIPSPLDGSPDWETWHGVQNLHSSVRTSLVLLFSSLWVTLAGMGFDFTTIVSLQPSCWGFISVFWCGLSFFGGFQHPSPQVAQPVENLPVMKDTWFEPCVRKIPWGRAWQPTPVFLPGEFYGQRRLVGYSSWGRKEWDITERLTLTASSCSWLFNS